MRCSQGRSEGGEGAGAQASRQIECCFALLRTNNEQVSEF